MGTKGLLNIKFGLPGWLPGIVETWYQLIKSQNDKLTVFKKPRNRYRYKYRDKTKYRYKYRDKEICCHT